MHGGKLKAPHEKYVELRTRALLVRGLRRSACALLLNVLPLFMLLVPHSSSAELLDRVVASVNNEVITLSELNQAVGFNMAMGGGNGDPIAMRAETLEGIINRRLLVRDARRFKFAEVAGEEVESEILALRNRLGSDAAFAEFLNELDITRSHLGVMLAERLLVERFIEKKIGLFLRVSRDEARDYFNSRHDQFAGKQFQEVQKEITAMLEEQKLEQQVAQYLEDLRSKADVRVRL